MNAITKCYHNLIMDLLENNKMVIEGVDVEFRLSLKNSKKKASPIHPFSWTVRNRDYYFLKVYINKEKVSRKKLKEYQVKSHLGSFLIIYSPQDPKEIQIQIATLRGSSFGVLAPDSIWTITPQTFNKIIQAIEDYLEDSIAECTHGLIDYIEINENENDT